MSRENDLPVATAKQLEARNQKIISAVIEKADKLYPGTLALIGIYGSFMTGDIHEKSDLDLLILINDDRGWQLGCAFVQDDLQVGHDIYCTNWESLERDAAYTHPNISKLLDAKIVYCADEKYMEKLLALREEAKDRMQAAFSEADYEKAEQFLKEAECLYDRVMTAEKLSEAYAFAGKVLCLIENAIAMLNKAYFRYGRKRVFEELHQMKKRPENLVQLLGAVAAAENLAELQEALTKLLVETRKAFAHAGEAFENVGEMFEDVREVNAQAEIQQDETRVCAVLQEEKETATSPEDASGQQADKNLADTHQAQPVTAGAIWGTYEEMYSNWRNKMYLAAKENDKYLAFSSMCSFNEMLLEIEYDVAIAHQEVFAKYYPNDLQKTAVGYDEILKNYLKEYEKVELKPRHYPDIEAFVNDYLKL